MLRRLSGCFAFLVVVWSFWHFAVDIHGHDVFFLQGWMLVVSRFVRLGGFSSFSFFLFALAHFGRCHLLGGFVFLRYEGSLVAASL